MQGHVIIAVMMMIRVVMAATAVVAVVVVMVVIVIIIKYTQFRKWCHVGLATCHLHDLSTSSIGSLIARIHAAECRAGVFGLHPVQAPISANSESVAAPSHHCANRRSDD